VTRTEGGVAALLMAYGAPATLDDVEAYFTHIRGGRRPPEERIEELRERYRLIGDISGLLRVTAEQARAVQEALDRDGGEPVKVFTGMRHSPPWIADSAQAIASEGYRTIIGLVLAPHFAAMSVGRYQAALESGLEGVEGRPDVVLVDHYGDDAGYVEAVREALTEALDEARGEGASAPHVIFTAHSLPARILNEGDPYKDQIESTARLVAGACGLDRWEVAFQSASPTGEPWIGPDFLERIDALASGGCREIIIAPIGFVSDHLEILYDVDILAKERGAKAGVRLWRMPMMNTRPAFARALAAVIRRTLAGAPARRGAGRASGASGPPGPTADSSSR